VVVPAVRWGGEKAAELVMGKTSLREVLRMLPPFPRHGPENPRHKDDPRLSEEIYQVLGRINHQYNPAATQTSVGFDKKKKLILVHNRIEREQAKRFADELDAVADMHEAFRDSEYLVRRGKLTPCVIVETNAILWEGNAARVNSVGYFFTCKT
jgi:hypothetical protein